MFVATVPDKIHGAGVIAYPNFMEDAAQKMGGDFFVLPSSIHEVLLVKDNGQMTAKELENMVKEVNATQVEPADQLTDHVYHYDQTDRVFELRGKSLAPGFIDGHSHNDWFAIKKDPLPYFAPFLRQGIATFVTGNCGISAIGFEPGCPHMDVMGAGLFSFDNTTGAYGTLDEFFDAVDGNMPCNLAVLAGHCSARAAVSTTSRVVNWPTTSPSSRSIRR